MNHQEAQVLYNQINSMIKRWEVEFPNHNQLPKMKEQSKNLKKLFPKLEEVE